MGRARDPAAAGGKAYHRSATSSRAGAQAGRPGLLLTDYFTFENLQDPDSFVENSDILFMISKQDVEPFKMISCNNVDGSKLFHYNLFDKNLDYIELKLTNEKDELILDASDYVLNLQIIVKDKQLDLLTDTSGRCHPQNLGYFERYQINLIAGVEIFRFLQ